MLALMSATTLISQDDNSQLVFNCQWKPSLEEISPALLSRPKETDVVKLLGQLSHAFTTRSDLLKSYGQDRDFVSAYAQVFLTTNIPKLEFILNALPKDLAKSFEEDSWQFIDFGCGPGTYSLAWLKRFPNSSCLPIDSAGAMLEQAQALVKHLYGAEKLSSECTDQKKVLFFGNVINEVHTKLILEQIEKYDPEVLMFIEPGTKASFIQVSALREQLLSKDFQILYPCFTGAKCPIAPVGKAEPSDWCHQVLRMSHDQSVERLCQLARLDRKILPMIGHIYCRKSSLQVEQAQSDVQHARIIQYLQENKHAFEYRVCMERDGENQMKKAILPKKLLSKEQKKALKKASVGTQIAFSVTKQSQDAIHIKMI